MCKKQISVSDSSTESEIMFWMLDYAWMGYLFLIFGVVLEVLRSTNNTVPHKHTSMQETDATLHSKNKTLPVKRRQKVEQLNDVDYVHQTHTFFSQVNLSCTSLKTTKP